jgi:hypothetical protein
MIASSTPSHNNIAVRITIDSVARILFIMAEVGYLRIYGDTVRALAAAGHDVRLGYNKAPAAGRDAHALDGLASEVTTIGVVPEHGGPWRDSLISLGCTADYVRFLSTREGTPYLRRRMEKYLPAGASWLRQVTSWPEFLVRTLTRLAATVERAVPVDPALRDFIADQAADAMVITPLVLRGPGGVQQTQLVKAARVLGMPVGLAVASWDHLSSKGLIRVDPDLVMVWNEVQKREALASHAVPESRVTITGAQLFDLWFGRIPSLDRAAFLSRVGLSAQRPVVLYAGSSRGIISPEREIAFVRRWLDAIRRSPDPVLQTASVLIRPHLSNVNGWADIDLSDYGSVSIWPRQRPVLPMNALETSDYFHSLHYSAVVVGINTSAMIESVILDRPTCTVELPEYADAQTGTKHFHYLVPAGGGPVESSRDLDAHLSHLSRALAEPRHGQAARQRFVEHFVRPHGLEQPAVDAVVAAIGHLARLRPQAMQDPPRWLAPARWLLKRATWPAPPAG